MIIASVASELLRLPLPRPMSSGSLGGAGGKPFTSMSMPQVIIMIENGMSGLEITLILIGDTLAFRRALAGCQGGNTTQAVQLNVIDVDGTTDGQSVMTSVGLKAQSIAPHHMMEASIRQACGVKHQGPIEPMPWIARACAQRSLIKGGDMLPAEQPGLGLNVT